MSKTTEVLRGIVHGRSIELKRALSVPDGSEIEFVIQRVAINAEQRQKRLEAIFGICEADSRELDDFLNWNREQRKRNRSEVEG